MSDPTFLIVGTPGGQWATWFAALPIADAADPVAPGRSESAGAVDTKAAQAQPQQDAQVLVVVERPALGLAAALARSQVDDPTRWLQDWCEGARRLLWRAQSDPLSCLLVDAEEAWLYPEALAACVEQRFGLDMAAASAAPVQADIDPLSRALAEAIALADLTVQALFAELQASCIMLATEVPVIASLPGVPQIDGPSAVQLLQSLRRRLLTFEGVAERRANELAAASLQSQALEQQLAEQAEGLLQQVRAQQAQSQALHDALAERANALRELGEVRQESELLQQQLLQVQEELESVFLGRREAEQRLSAAAAGCDGQDRHATELARQLKEAQLAHQASEKAGQDRAAALSKSQSEVAARQRETIDLRQENELMLQQLHQVQEELEHYYLECRRLKEVAASMVPAAAGLKLAVAEAVPSAERDTPPHRELSFQLRRVVVDDREIPEATVRLVEHHGHPGLVLFGNEPGAQLLSGWRETGREDGRPFMLLVPADAPVRSMLETMGHADWLLLQSLPARLEQALAAEDPPLPLHWQQLARRLHAQLQAHGRRFRYRQAQVEPAADAPSGALAFQFSQVHCGTHQVPRLSLQWQPGGPQAGLTLMNDSEAGPPLTSWPADEHGAPVDRLRLPLGPDVALREKRQAWTRLAPPDRDFMLAMLSIWPEAVAQGAVNSSPDAAALQSPAKDLHLDALRATRRSTGWSRLRRAAVEPRRT